MVYSDKVLVKCKLFVDTEGPQSGSNPVGLGIYLLPFISNNKTERFWRCPYLMLPSKGSSPYLLDSSLFCAKRFFVDAVVFCPKLFVEFCTRYYMSCNRGLIVVRNGRVPLIPSGQVIRHLVRLSTKLTAFSLLQLRLYNPKWSKNLHTGHKSRIPYCRHSWLNQIFTNFGRRWILNSNKKEDHHVASSRLWYKNIRKRSLSILLFSLLRMCYEDF